VVTGVGRGTVVITATSAFNPRLSASIELLIGPALPPPASPTFSLTLNPASGAAEVGKSVLTRATITPANGFTGVIAFSLVDAPAGITLTGGPLNLTSADASTVILGIGVGSVASVGEHNLTVRATHISAAGSLVREATFALRVTAPQPPPGPTFSIGLEPNSGTIAAGGNASTVVAVTPQHGFTGNVTFSLESPPAGVTLTGGPANVTGSAAVNANLSIATTSATPVGVHHLTIRAVSGTIVRDTPFALTVEAAVAPTPPPPPPPSVSFDFVLDSLGAQVPTDSAVSVRATITPQHGFTGNVTFSLVSPVNPLTGITLTGGPANITGTAPVSANLSLNVAPNAYPMLHHLTIRATSGDLVREAPFSLNVTGPRPPLQPEPPPVIPPPSPSISFSLSPTAGSVNAGSSATTVATITPQHGFTGNVAFSLVSPPAGIALTGGPANITGTAAVNANLSIATTNATPVGAHNLTVRATAGSLVREATFALTVTAPPPPPSFTLALNPTAGILGAGPNVGTTATITPQHGFTGDVTLSLVNPPAGLGLSGQPRIAVTGANPVSLTVYIGTLSTRPPPGTYAVTIRATAGTLVSDATFTLTVASIGIPSFTAALSLTAGTVDAGGSATSVATITPRHGFTGSVAFSLVNPPAGISLTGGPVSVTDANAVSATLSLATTGTAPLGVHNLTIRATSGSLVRDIPFALTVRGFTSALDLASAAINVGDTADNAVTITPQYGFVGDVFFALLNQPEGVGFVGWPLGVTGTSPVRQSLQIMTNNATPVGVHNMTIRARAGNLARYMPFTLTVRGFTATLSATSAIVNAGSSTATVATITPQHGFTGNVAFSLVNPPTGITLTGGPANITGTSGVGAALNIVTTTAAPPGVHNLTIRASSGRMFRDVAFTLAVNPPPPPSMTFSLSPTAGTVDAGSSTATTATITPQHGFTGNVAFSLVSPPAGVTLTGGPANVTGTSAVSANLNIATTGATPVGVHNLTIRATSGTLVREATFALTVRSYTAALAWASATINAGTSANTEAIITPQHGFTGNVTFSLVSPPAGVTLTGGPANVTSTAAVNANLSIATTNATPVGVHNLTVRATAGSLVRDMTFALTVRGFAFGLTHTSGTKNNSGRQAILIQSVLTPQYGFAGTVTISLVNPPPGTAFTGGDVTLTPDRNEITFSRIVAGRNTPPGVYNLVLRATSGTVVREAVFVLTVVPSQ
jgi:hypothetical protein